MAAYIRPATVPVRKESHRINAKSQTESDFSLSCQLDQNHNKLRRAQEHEEQTLIFQNQNSSAMQ